MKIEGAGHYLQSLRNQPLEEISVEDVDNTIQAYSEVDLQKRKQNVLASFDQLKVSRRRGVHSTASQLYTSPHISRFTPSHLQNLQRTPFCFQKLINLSYSQPTTPKTPFAKQYFDLHATPFAITNIFRTPLDSYIPPTPIVLDPLTVFEQNNFNDFYCGPDILQMIDNDGQTLQEVDKQLREFSAADLTDSNLVDYLLDIADDFTVIQSTEKPNATEENAVDLKCKRKCARAKPMTKEEREAMQKHRKKKNKQKRKERNDRFKKQSNGVRRSTRSSTKIKYF